MLIIFALDLVIDGQTIQDLKPSEFYSFVSFEKVKLIYVIVIVTLPFITIPFEFQDLIKCTEYITLL